MVMVNDTDTSSMALPLRDEHVYRPPWAAVSPPRPNSTEAEMLRIHQRFLLRRLDDTQRLHLDEYKTNGER